MTTTKVRKFHCVQGCSDCCIHREYYPSVKYGKIGVLVLPQEKDAIERLAKKLEIGIRIVPRLAIGKNAPEKIIAYQMMGKNKDGDLCPFLDVTNAAAARSPHGGYQCRIYKERPLACRAYPVIDAATATTRALTGAAFAEYSSTSAILDGHCQFCRKFSTEKASTEGLQQEIEALSKIKASVAPEAGLRIWRYATGVARPEDRENLLPEGWVSEEEAC